MESKVYLSNIEFIIFLNLPVLNTENKLVGLIGILFVGTYSVSYVSVCALCYLLNAQIKSGPSKYCAYFALSKAVH
jgi:hypothetical protein